MPRANRCYVEGHIWHVTHRCHRRRFLLRFVRDRRAWVDWLYEARRRLGLCVLDYTVTSNHVHLLVRDRGLGVIADSMQLIAGRTAQAFNDRKHCNGAFWEDRYHATAVDDGTYLARCLVYIDLNLVRAGVVADPALWETGGYHEIQSPVQRYRIIDRDALAQALGLDDPTRIAPLHREWIEAALQQRHREREPHWSESVAVGRRAFVERVQADLHTRARVRRIDAVSGGERFILHDPGAPYSFTFATENERLRPSRAPNINAISGNSRTYVGPTRLLSAARS